MVDKGKFGIKKGKVYVPKNKELRIEIILLHHDIPAAKYRRRWKDDGFGNIGGQE